MDESSHRSGTRNQTSDLDPPAIHAGRVDHNYICVGNETSGDAG